MYTVFRGIFVGFKSIILFYIYFIIPYAVLNIPIPIFLFGLLNGFIDGIVISIKNTTKYKIISSIIGFFISIFTLLLSLQMKLPDILADYYIYGEDGGGLAAGGWFAFTFDLLIYFVTSLFLSFPFTMLCLSLKKELKELYK